MYAAAAAKSLQSCPTLCDPIDGSPPGSSVHEISREGYWSGLPFLSPGDLPNPGIKPGSPALQADPLPTELLLDLDCSLRGSSVHGIFQARILEWVAISFSRRYSRPRD